MTNSATTAKAHRLSAGCYSMTDALGREWQIVLNPAGWVAYVVQEPVCADRFNTLREAREMIAGIEDDTGCEASEVGYHVWNTAGRCVWCHTTDAAEAVA